MKKLTRVVNIQMRFENAHDDMESLQRTLDWREKAEKKFRSDIEIKFDPDVLSVSVEDIVEDMEEEE